MNTVFIPFSEQEKEARIFVDRQIMDRWGKGAIDLIHMIRENEDPVVFEGIKERTLRYMDPNDFEVLNQVFQLDPRIPRRPIPATFSLKMKIATPIIRAFWVLSNNYENI